MVPPEPRSFGPKLCKSLINTPRELASWFLSMAERNRLRVQVIRGRQRIGYNIPIGAVSRVPSSRTCRSADVRPNRQVPRKEVAGESHIETSAQHSRNSRDNHRPGCRITDEVTVLSIVVQATQGGNRRGDSGVRTIVVNGPGQQVGGAKAALLPTCCCRWGQTENRQCRRWHAVDGCQCDWYPLAIGRRGGPGGA
jgi:hypothetical protein